MTEALTVFDAVALTLIIISALMAVARGFVRELATLGAFIAALAAAYYARIALRGPMTALLPGGLPDWSADALIVVVVFLSVYVLVAWGGQRLSKNIQGIEGIGLIDRLAGLAFGIARGGVAMVFFVYLLQLGLEADRIPEEISGARTYPYFANAANYIQEYAPELAEEARNSQPPDPLRSQR